MDDVDLQDLMDKAAESIKTLVGGSDNTNAYVDAVLEQMFPELDINGALTGDQQEAVEHATASIFKSLIAYAIVFW